MRPDSPVDLESRSIVSDPGKKLPLAPRVTQGQMKKNNNIVFIQNCDFLILSERLMAIDRKNTKISAV